MGKTITKRQQWWKKYRAKNRDKIRKAGRKYHHKTYHIHKEEKSLYQKNRRLFLKLKTIKKYGGKCVGCGEVDLETLTIDHINNDGYARKQGLFGVKFYHKLLNEPIHKDLQILCHSCQWRKREYGNDISLWQKRAILTDKDPYKAISKIPKWINSVEYRKKSSKKLRKHYKNPKNRGQLGRRYRNHTKPCRVINSKLKKIIKQRL